MASSLATRRRASTESAEAGRPAAPGVYVSATDLAMLEGQARHLAFRPGHPARNLLAGRHASRVRGRGLDFEDLRQYQPGDDVRTIDWTVTARMPEAFVRVYTEEKDRPVTLVVDQRINMFFGTRRAMKSVTAAEAAALCGWRAHTSGDRVGGVVFDDEAIHVHRTARGRGALLQFLGRMASRNNALRADSPASRNPEKLDEALACAARLAMRDHLVVVVTDCDGRGAHTRDWLRRIAMRNDVVLFLVFDPFLLELPASNDLVVTNGDLQVEIPLASGRVRRSIAEAGDQRIKDILQWRHEIGVSVVPLNTAEDTAAQLRRLIGSRAGRGAKS